MKIYDRELQYSFYESTTSYTTLLKHGDTSILVKLNIGNWVGYEGSSFKCKYSERWYAANKIPAGFIKREPKGRPYEAYISDLIFRSLSPNISDSFRFKIDLNCILIGCEHGAAVESLVINAVYVALRAAGVPCNPVAALQMSYVKEWALGNYGDRTCIACGNAFNISLFEGYNIPAEELKTGMHFAYNNIKDLIDYNESCLAKIKHKQVKTYNANLIMQNIYVGDILDPRAILKAYQHNDVSVLNEYKQKFVERYGSADIGAHHYNKCLQNIMRAETLWNNKRVDQRSYSALAKFSVDKTVSKIGAGVIVSSMDTLVAAFTTASNRGDVYNVESLHNSYTSKIIVHCNSLTDDCHDVVERSMSHVISNVLKKYINADRLIRIVIEILYVGGNLFISMMRAIIESVQKCNIQTPSMIYYNLGIISDGANDAHLIDISQEEEKFVDGSITSCISNDIIYYSCAGKMLSWKSMYNAVNVMLNHNHSKQQNKHETDDSSTRNEQKHNKTESVNGAQHVRHDDKRLPRNDIADNRHKPKNDKQDMRHDKRDQYTNKTEYKSHKNDQYNSKQDKLDISQSRNPNVDHDINKSYKNDVTPEKHDNSKDKTHNSDYNKHSANKHNKDMPKNNTNPAQSKKNDEYANKNDEYTLELELFKNMNIEQDLIKDLIRFAKSNDIKIMYDNNKKSLQLGYSTKHNHDLANADNSISDVGAHVYGNANMDDNDDNSSQNINNLRKTLDFICTSLSNDRCHILYGVVDIINEKEIIAVDYNTQKKYTAKFSSDFVKGDVVLIQKKSKARFVDLVNIARKSNI
jgi:hypothetical protein